MAQLTKKANVSATNKSQKEYRKCILIAASKTLRDSKRSVSSSVVGLLSFHL
jgi:hypothetical protein